MAQLLIESRHERVKVLENATEGGVLRFEAVVSEADYINQNRRMYPERVLFPAFEKVNADPARHPGAVDHPDPYGPVSVSDLGIAWEGFRFEGSQVIGTGRIIPTQKGRDLQAAMEADVAIGFSTRGRGLTEEQTIDGRTINVLTEFDLTTVDAVIDPSVGHARIRSYTKEEREGMEKELKDALEAKGAAEGKLAEAQAALETANARVAELEAAATEQADKHSALEARIAELQAAAAERQAQEAADALEARLLVLTGEHRFGATIRAEARKLNVTLETAEQVVGVLTGLVESAAAASNEEQGAPRGDVSTDEDTAIADSNALSEDQLAELRAAGLL